jgi:hypothetical protein
MTDNHPAHAALTGGEQTPAEHRANALPVTPSHPLYPPELRAAISLVAQHADPELDDTVLLRLRAAAELAHRANTEIGRQLSNTRPLLGRTCTDDELAELGYAARMAFHTEWEPAF